MPAFPPRTGPCRSRSRTSGPPPSCPPTCPASWPGSLRPGGAALLTWYNRNALVNDWFYPWPATVHSHLNPHNDTLEVWSGGSVYTIRARAMTVDEAREACGAAGLGFRLAGTYPTLQPILPAFVARSPRARALYETCRQLDDHLAAPGIDRGSFITAVVSRPRRPRGGRR